MAGEGSILDKFLEEIRQSSVVNSNSTRRTTYCKGEGYSKTTQFSLVHQARVESPPILHLALHQTL